MDPLWHAYTALTLELDGVCALGKYVAPVVKVNLEDSCVGVLSSPPKNLISSDDKFMEKQLLSLQQ